MNITWKPLGLVLLVLTIPVIANVVLICVVWRTTVHAHYDAETIAAVERLVEQTGLLRSTELSLIRFRLRLPGGHEVPLTGPHARLACRLDESWKPIASETMSAGGTLDFDFNPPGSYRLTLETVDGMTLQHEFEVQRGSHHDRLIICPMRSGRDAQFQIVVNWPKRLMREDLIAVYRIEPAAFVDGEWTWQPNENWRPVLAVTGNANGSPLPNQWKSFREVSAVFAGDIQPADEVILPYRYCRLTEITFLRRSASNREGGLVRWATVSFREPHDDALQPCTSTMQWQADVPLPEFDALQNPAGRWVIDCPIGIADELLKRLSDQPV